nr:uncharacterized protein LOC109146618 [Ipomoea trifida]
MVKAVLVLFFVVSVLTNAHGVLHPPPLPLCNENSDCWPLCKTASSARSGPGLEYGLGPGSATLSGSKAITAGRSDSSRPSTRAVWTFSSMAWQPEEKAYCPYTQVSLSPTSVLMKAVRNSLATASSVQMNRARLLASFILSMTSFSAFCATSARASASPSFFSAFSSRSSAAASSLSSPRILPSGAETCFWRGTTSFSRMPSSARARLKRSVVVWESCEREERSELPHQSEPVSTVENTYPEDVLGDLFAEPVARPPHDGLQARDLVPYLVDKGENLLNLRLLALLFPSPTRAKGHLKVGGYASTGRAVDGGGVGDVDDGGIGGRLAGDLLRAQGHLHLGARGGSRSNERSVERHTCTSSNGLQRVDLIDLGPDEEAFLLLNDLAVQEDHLLSGRGQSVGVLISLGQATLMVVGGQARKNLLRPVPKACEIGTRPRELGFAGHIATLEGRPFDEWWRQFALRCEGRVGGTSSRAPPELGRRGRPKLRGPIMLKKVRDGKLTEYEDSGGEEMLRDVMRRESFVYAREALISG